MVSIKDVARHAGVSIGTVSNVINRPNLVSEDTRNRVRSAIERLGYVRSESARQLRAGRSRTVALLLFDMGNPFFAEIARGAQRAARAAGLGVMVCDTAQSAGEEAYYLGIFAEQRVRGVLVTSADPGGAHLGAFRRHRIPVVYADQAVPRRQACSVSVDNVAGGTLAGRHLAACGHRRIAYVGGPLHLPPFRDRYTGALRAVAQAGLPERSVLPVAAERLDVAAGREAGMRLLSLRERPTAVFCANDLLALGVLQALYAAGVRVPSQMSLVGYDDIEFAAAAAVPLTSVRQPAFDIGRAAAQLLIEETGDRTEAHTHRSVVFRPALVVRASTAPVER